MNFFARLNRQTKINERLDQMERRLEKLEKNEKQPKLRFFPHMTLKQQIEDSLAERIRRSKLSESERRKEDEEKAANPPEFNSCYVDKDGKYHYRLI
jgi:TolA-binding protein